MWLSISNIYLHYSFDLWLNKTRKHAQGRHGDGQVCRRRCAGIPEARGCPGVSVGPETAAGEIWSESPSGENPTGTLWSFRPEPLSVRPPGLPATPPFSLPRPSGTPCVF